MILVTDDFADESGYIVHEHTISHGMHGNTKHATSTEIQVMLWLKDVKTRRIVYPCHGTMKKRAKEFLDSPARDFSDLHRMIAKMYIAYLGLNDNSCILCENIDLLEKKMV